MNKLGTGTKIAIFMLVISVIVMIFLLNYSSNLQKAKVNDINPSSNGNEPTKVDKLPEQNEDNKKIIVTNFKASLADVLYGTSLIGKYSVEKYYSGARFNFNCTKYEEDKCIAGSALMDIGTAVLPLYTFENVENDFYSHLSDYYIIVTDNNIILTSNYAGKKAGKIRLYDKEGKIISEINNVITGYISNSELVDQLYPNLVDNNLSYYVCTSNKVYSNKVSINNPGIVTSKNQIPSVKCF